MNSLILPWIFHNEQYMFQTQSLQITSSDQTFKGLQINLINWLITSIKIVSFNRIFILKTSVKV